MKNKEISISIKLISFLLVSVMILLNTSILPVYASDTEKIADSENVFVSEADIQSTDSEDDAYFKSKEYLSFLELEHALATHGKVQFNRGEAEYADFDDCHILVALNFEDDDRTKYVDAAYFPELEIDEIEDITLPEGVRYRYVSLLITIKNKGKSSVLDACELLNLRDDVLLVSPNHYIERTPDTVPSDPLYSANSAPFDYINATDLWSVTTGSSNVKIGVLDVGVKNHEDLVANLITGYDAYNNNNITNDTENDHGTHVAGIIGAVANNNKGLCGLNWNVSIVPLQFGLDETMHQNLTNYLKTNKIKVVNESMGSNQFFKWEQSNILNWGGLWCCSAGNEGVDTDIYKHYPSSYDNTNILSVAALNDNNLNLASYSNFAKNTVDIAAPAYITSTIGTSEYVPNHGTSMAAPMVTGTAGLLLSKCPSLSASELKSFILQGSTHRSFLVNKCVSEGTLNAKKSYDLLDAYGEWLDNKVLSGDFDGDGKDDIANIYDCGTGMTYINVMISTGSAFLPATEWYSSRYASFVLNNVGNRITVGDFNGDGKDDIAILYDYGSGHIKILVFISTGNGFENKSYSTWYDSGSSIFNVSNIGNRFVSGDFNGDGKDDVSCFYDMGNGRARLIMFLSNGSAFASGGYTTWYDNTGYYLGFVKDRFFAGDINNDGYDDIVTFYDYGNGRMKLHTFTSNGTSIGGNAYYTWYDSVSGLFSQYADGRINCSDLTGDGKADVSIMYNMGNGRCRLIVFVSTGAGILNSTYSTWYDRGNNSFYLDRVSGRCCSGDFDGNGYNDICANYDYNSGNLRNLVFKSIGNGFVNSGWYTWSGLN